MFETSVVRARAAAPRNRVRLLSLSLAAHSLVIVGAVTLSVASVDFPEQAPDQLQLAPNTFLVTVPPPLGNPNGGARPQPQPAAAPKPPEPRPSNEVTAPPAVPDAIVPATANNAATTTATGEGDPNAAGTGTVPGPVGVPWGDPNSVAGDLNLPPATATQPEEKIYEVKGDVRPPRVISRVEPRYPQVMIAAKKSATVRVRCIVDKHGSVQSAEIVFSSFPPFNESAVEAVRQWRFAPGSLNATAVDTIFELTVNFQVR